MSLEITNAICSTVIVCVIIGGFWWAAVRVIQTMAKG